MITLFNLAILGLAGVPLEAFPGLGRTLLPSNLPKHPWFLLLLSLVLGLTVGPLLLAGSLNSLIKLFHNERVSVKSYFRTALANFQRAFWLTLTALGLSLALGLLGGIGLLLLYFVATLLARLLTGAPGTLLATLLIFMPALAYGLWFGETILSVPIIGFTRPALSLREVLSEDLHFAWRQKGTLLALGVVVSSLILAILLLGGLVAALPILGPLAYVFVVQLASLFGQFNLLVYWFGLTSPPVRSGLP